MVTLGSFREKLKNRNDARIKSGKYLKKKSFTMTFTANIEIFEREMGWYYVSVPTDLSKSLEYFADRGLIAVTAKIGNSTWPTSLLPMGDGTHCIALPAKVRSKEKLSLGMTVELSFETRVRKN